MANILERTISILVGNLNSSQSYLITAVSISQKLVVITISEVQNHLQKNLTSIFLSISVNTKSTLQYGTPCSLNKSEKENSIKPPCPNRFRHPCIYQKTGETHSHHSTMYITKSVINKSDHFNFEKRHKLSYIHDLQELFRTFKSKFYYKIGVEIQPQLYEILALLRSLIIFL